MINSILKRFKNFGLGKLTVLFIYLAIFFLVLYTPVLIKKFFHQKKLFLFAPLRIYLTRI